MIKRKNGVKAIITMVIVMIMLIISALPVAANEVSGQEFETTTIDAKEEQIDTKEKTKEIGDSLATIFAIIALICLVVAVIAIFTEIGWLLSMSALLGIPTAVFSLIIFCLN